MLVKVFGAAVFGINATIVTAEVNVEPGAYFFTGGPAGQRREGKPAAHRCRAA